MKKSILLLMLAFTFFSNPCKLYCQSVTPVYPYFTNNFVFGSGYWVYEDTINGAIDSIVLLNCTHDFTPQVPHGGPSPYEYYLMDFWDFTNQTAFNEYIIWDFWRRNGSDWGNGQCILPVGQSNSSPGLGDSCLGTGVMGIYNTLLVGNTIYNNVVWTHLTESQQYQHMFDYDTDFYFAEHIGIIRKEYTDSQNVHHVWNLVNYMNGPFVGVEEDIPATRWNFVYPNPSRDFIRVSANEVFLAEIYSLDGKQILVSDEDKIDISNLQSGLYMVILKDREEKVLGRDKLIKE